jgi:hypothetical protein
MNMKHQYFILEVMTDSQSTDLELSDDVIDMR